MDDRNFVVRSARSLAIAARRTFRQPRAAIRQTLLPSSSGFFLLVFAIACIVLVLIWHFDEIVLRPAIDFRDNNLPITKFFALVTEFGRSGWVLGFALVAGLSLSVSQWNALPRKTRLRRIARYANINFLFFTVAISGTLAYLLKNSIGRARPRHIDDLGPHYFELFAFESELASFPSGHATTFGGIFMVLTLLVPRFWPIWLVAGVFGASTRILLGAHYVSDTLVGLIFGAGFVWLSARWLAQRGTMFEFTSSWLPRRKR